MIAPVGVENAEFGFGWITPFLPEIADHLPEIIRIHGQAVFLAE